MGFNLYSPDQENNIYIRTQAQAWRRSGLITEGQLTAISNLSDPHVRRTNLFFRILFFIFTLLCIGAIAGLIVWFLEDKSDMALALIFFLCGGTGLAAAEYLVTKYRFYRHGIEEALAVAGMILCVAGFMILTEYLGLEHHQVIEVSACLILSAAACFVYLRFGYLYAAVIGMLALCVVPFQFSLSHTAERLILLGMFCAALGLGIYGDGKIVHDFKKGRSTLLLTCLLAAIYLTVNLHVFGVIGMLSGEIRGGHFHPESFPQSLYWISYVLTFLIPAAVIYAGIKTRRRLILNAGVLMAMASLATNKSYLGLTRYAWDPAILGAAMIAFSLLLTRWLNAGPERKRSGFTAAEILKPEDSGVSLADAAAALTPAAIEAGQPTQTLPAEPFTEGGASGGGGAQRKF